MEGWGEDLLENGMSLGHLCYHGLCAERKRKSLAGTGRQVAGCFASVRISAAC